MKYSSLILTLCIMSILSLFLCAESPEISLEGVQNLRSKHHHHEKHSHHSNHHKHDHHQKHNEEVNSNSNTENNSSNIENNQENSTTNITYTLNDTNTNNQTLQEENENISPNTTVTINETTLNQTQTEEDVVSNVNTAANETSNVVEEDQLITNNTSAQSCIEAHPGLNHSESNHSTNNTKESSSDLVDAVNNQEIHNSAADLNLVDESKLKSINNPNHINNLIEVKCFESCVKKCKATYPNNEAEINDCSIKVCRCLEEDLSSKLVPNVPLELPSTATKTWSELIIDCLIVISLLSLGASVLMISLILYRRRENSSREKYENQYDSINLDFSKELCEDKIDARIFEPNYELMTTEVDDEFDKEICIRDF